MIKLTEILNEAFLKSKSIDEKKFDFDKAAELMVTHAIKKYKAKNFKDFMKVLKNHSLVGLHPSLEPGYKSLWDKYSNLNEDCWKGYKQIGGKMKNGKMVPNCVPESVEENSINEASMTVSIANIVDELFPKEFFWVYNPKDRERVKSVISDLVRTLNTFYKKQGIKVRFTDTNFKMKMYAKESAREDLTSSERLELYKLYSKAMKAMPQSPNQKKIIKKINVLRTKAGMKPLKEVTLNEIGVFNIHSYTKGILPPGYMDTTTPQKKEKYRSTVRDLVQTLNSFWKRNNIPFRVRK